MSIKHYELVERGDYRIWLSKEVVEASCRRWSSSELGGGGWGWGGDLIFNGVDRQSGLLEVVIKASRWR